MKLDLRSYSNKNSNTAIDIHESKSDVQVLIKLDVSFYFSWNLAAKVFQKITVLLHGCCPYMDVRVLFYKNWSITIPAAVLASSVVKQLNIMLWNFCRQCLASLRSRRPKMGIDKALYLSSITSIVKQLAACGMYNKPWPAAPLFTRAFKLVAELNNGKSSFDDFS